MAAVWRQLLFPPANLIVAEQAALFRPGHARVSRPSRRRSCLDLGAVAPIRTAGASGDPRRERARLRGRAQLIYPVGNLCDKLVVEAVGVQQVKELSRVPDRRYVKYAAR